MGDAVKPALHGRDHCPGGTDPIPCLSPSYCYMTWNGTEAVTVNTMVNPISLDDYEESFVVENDGASFQCDRTSGIISWQNPGEYLVTAWVGFQTGAAVGSILGGILDFGQSGGFGTHRVGNSVITDSINGDFRIPIVSPVFAFNPGVTGFNNVRVLVHHDDAGGVDLGTIRIHVMRRSAVVAGVFDP